MAVVLQVIGEYDGKQLAKAQRDLDKLKSGVEGGVSAYQAAGGGLAGVAAQGAVVGAKMASVGKAMTLGVTLPLIGIGAAGVKTAADFDSTMALMQVNSGASGQQMKQLSDLAMKMGSDTVFSAGEAASAMLELSKGGMKNAEIAGGGVQAAMALAATEGMDLAQAAGVVGTQMATFGLKAKDASKITDMLAAGSLASKASVQDLADGMKYVGSSAAAMGMPMDDAVTSLTMLNQAGLDGTTAGTSLNRMLLGLAAPSKNAAKAFGEYGVSLTDAKGQMLPMREVIGQLQDKLGGLSDTERAAALKRMFGVEGMRAANILMADGVKGYDKYNAAVNQQGKAQDMANARMSGMAGALEKMRGSLETAAQAVGNALEPVVLTVSGGIEKVANAFTALPAGVQTGIVAILGVAAAIGPVLLVVGKIASGFGAMVSVVGSVGGALSTLVGVVRTAMSAITGVMMANPWILIVVALVAVVALIVTHWETVKSYLATAWQWISATAGAIWSGIQSVLTTIWNAISAAATFIFDAIKAYFSFVLTAYQTVFTTVWNAISTALGVVWNAIKVAATVIFDGIKAYFDFVLGLYHTVFTTVWDAISGALGVIWNAIKTAATAVFDAIKTYFETVLGLYHAAFTTVWDAIKTVTETVWNAIKTTITALFDAAKAGVEVTLGLLHAAMSAVWTTIKAAADTGWGLIKTAITAPVTAAKGAVTGTIDALKTALDGAWDLIKSGASTAWGKIKDAMVHPVEAAKTAISGIVDEIKGAINGVIDKINGATARISALHVTAPKGLPIIGGKTFNFPDIPSIPKLADGGIVTAPTLALIGEDGPEKVVPLNSPRADKFAAGRQVTIARGAIQVTVHTSQAASTDVAAAVQAAVEDALAALLREVRAA